MQNCGAVSLYESLPEEVVSYVTSFLSIYELFQWKMVCRLSLSIYRKQIKSRNQIFNEAVKNQKSVWSWKRVHCRGQKVPSQWSSSCVVLPLQPERVLVFGGESEGYRFYNDIYILHLETQLWERQETLGPKPPARGFPSVVLVKHEGIWHVLVHGGQSRLTGNDWKFYNDIFLLNIETWTWKKIDAAGDIPPPKVGQRSVCLNDTLWVFGGTFVRHFGYTYLDDLHFLNLRTMVWTKVHQRPNSTWPSKRQSSTLTKIDNTKLLLVAGNCDVGNHDAGTLNDAYIFDTESLTWTQLDLLNGAEFTKRWCHATCRIDELTFLVESGWTAPSAIPFNEYWLLHLGQKKCEKFKIKSQTADPANMLFFCFIRVFDFFLLMFGTNEERHQSSDLVYILSRDEG